jgi:hypothetical protein
VCLNFGIVVSGTRPETLTDRDTATIVHKHLVTQGVYWMLLVGFSFGFAIYLATIARTFGLEALLSSPDTIRGETTVRYLEVFPLYGKLFFYLGPVCLILTVFPEFVEGLRGRALGLRLAVMAYIAGAQLATLQRTVLFVGITWAAGLLVLRLKTRGADGRFSSVNVKRIASIAIAAIVGLIAFQGLALALGKTGTENVAISSRVSPGLRGNPATALLLYASGGIPAFGRLVDSTNEDWPPEDARGAVYGAYNPQTWGAATFAGPLKLVPMERHWSEVAPFVSLPVPTNVYTWLEPWYRDFRWVGVLLGSILIGLVMGSFARRRSGSPEAMLAASLLVGFSALAAFTNRFMTVISIVIYVTIFVLGVLRRMREAAEARNTGVGLVVPIRAETADIR